MFRVQSGGRMIRKPQTEPSKTPTSAAPRPEEVATRPLAPSQFTAAHDDTADIPTVTPQEARQLLRLPKPPTALNVSGSLNLSGAAWLHFLPEWLRCESLNVDDCPNLTNLPSDLHAGKVSARRCPKLHEVTGRLSVRGSLTLAGSGLERLDADLHASRLNLASCTDLREVRGAVSVTHLDLRGCSRLSELPISLHVTQALEVADCGLRSMPAHLRAGLRWNDVPVSAKVAFAPETLSGRDVMNIRNVQHRRVLLERLGIDRFLADVGGLILDRDTDAGGERQLVHVPFHDDEDLVAVLVKCPSTGGSYALRVPPHVRTCREAVAWTAGLSVQDYQPTQEA